MSDIDFGDYENAYESLATKFVKEVLDNAWQEMKKNHNFGRQGLNNEWTGITLTDNQIKKLNKDIKQALDNAYALCNDSNDIEIQNHDTPLQAAIHSSQWGGQTIDANADPEAIPHKQLIKQLKESKDFEFDTLVKSTPPCVTQIQNVSLNVNKNSVIPQFRINALDCVKLIKDQSKNYEVSVKNYNSELDKLNSKADKVNSAIAVEDKKISALNNINTSNKASIEHNNKTIENIKNNIDSMSVFKKLFTQNGREEVKNAKENIKQLKNNNEKLFNENNVNLIKIDEHKDNKSSLSKNMAEINEKISRTELLKGVSEQCANLSKQISKDFNDININLAKIDVLKQNYIKVERELDAIKAKINSILKKPNLNTADLEKANKNLEILTNRKIKINSELNASELSIKESSEKIAETRKQIEQEINKGKDIFSQKSHLDGISVKTNLISRTISNVKDMLISGVVNTMLEVNQAKKDHGFKFGGLLPQPIENMLNGVKEKIERKNELNNDYKKWINSLNTYVVDPRIQQNKHELSGTSIAKTVNKAAEMAIGR